MRPVLVLALVLTLLLLPRCTPKSRTLDAGSVQDAAIDATAIDAAQGAIDAGPVLLPGARLSAGCASGATLARGLVKEASIEAAGRKRTYVAFSPKSASGSPLRIVFAFHGDVRTGMDVRGGLMLEEQADDEAIFVYPDGLDKTWKTEDASPNNPDYVLFDVLLEHFGKEACIDFARVFLVGFSRGAFFANQLGCRRDVRAIAPIAGGGPYVLPGDAKGAVGCPNRPAVMLFHGDADTNVPFGSGRTSRDFWVRANGCKATTSAFDPSPCVASEGCAEGHPVIWCGLPKHPHRVWKEAPAAIWRFFRGF